MPQNLRLSEISLSSTYNVVDSSSVAPTHSVLVSWKEEKLPVTNLLPEKIQVQVAKPTYKKFENVSCETGLLLAQDFGARLSQALTQIEQSSLDTNAIEVCFHENIMKSVFKLPEFAKKFILGFLTRSTPLKKFTKNSLILKKNIRVLFPQLQFNFLTEGLKTYSSCNLTRSLVNAPPNYLNPTTYEIFVQEHVSQIKNETNGKISFEVFNEEKLEQDGAMLFCAVSKGSPHASRLLKISYTPEHLSQLRYSIVGKGITFDSGGLDIKGSQFMRNMKKDMGGSASALGIFSEVVLRNIPANVTLWLALAENMTGSKAMKPGDVYKTKSGITVEIDNTDAEGRLVLADAITYAVEENPNLLVDLATLTGAARTALGPWVDALFSTDAHVASMFVEKSRQTGDYLWHMPMVEDYDYMLESNVADTTNSGPGGHAGSITATMFLKKFTQDIPWVHIDTYMWTDKSNEIYATPGATHKCVQVVSEILLELASKSLNTRVKTD
jgi:leucyl aminopeptidase